MSREVSKSGWEVMERSWELMQQRTFTAWVNQHLSKRGMSVEDIATEFDDGLKLIVLIEVISGNSLGRYNKKPKMVHSKVENLNIALRFINDFAQSSKIRVQFSAEDIMDHNKKLILGMLWVLIHKFSIEDISEEEQNARDGLLLWCKKKTSGYENVEVRDFHKSWRSGLAFCALIHRHKPNLIDFSSLDPSKNEENLELAFSVADKELGIYRLLDVQDMLTEKPDDKSVMTYVANYWREFAKGQKADVAASCLSKLAGRARGNKSVVEEYSSGASQLVSWIDGCISKYTTEDCGKSIEAVQEKIRELSEYRSVEKAAQTEKMLELESVLGNLIAKQKSEKTQCYVPPDEISQSTIQSKWEELDAVELKYEGALRENFHKQKKVAQLVHQFDNLLLPVTRWCDDRIGTVKVPSEGDSEEVNTIYGSTSSETQGRIRKNKALLEELGNMEEKMKSVGAKKDEIFALQEVSEVSSSESGTNEKLCSIRETAEKISEGLESRLKELQEIEEAKIDFAGKIQTVSLSIEEMQSFVSGGCVVFSVEEVEEALSAVAEKEKNLDEGDLKKLLNEVEGLDEKYQAGSNNAYTDLSLSKIHEDICSLKSKIEEYRTSLGESKKRLEENDELCKKFAELSKENEEWREGLRGRLDAVEGDLEERLDKTQEFQVEWSGYKDKLNELDTLSQSMVERGISENPYTNRVMQDISVGYESLGKMLKDRVATLEKQVLEKKSAGELTAEQLADFQQSFKFFDKDNSNTLSKSEIAACLASLGEEISESELDKEFGELEEMTFEPFCKLMLKRVQKQDTKNDVVDAFSTLGGVDGKISGSALLGSMKKEDAEELISLLEPVEGEEDMYRYDQFLQRFYSE
eukprot:TRINITY_DN350_c0_g1_i10.p1 TRINITY_DN350_c0_g1~~TRINITY_DN350_c0_g1_i10.p1  ORF type:complete len:865 (-),score=297.82 TRINITY_DN350_c0_g1_i10:97-2691(-)